MPGAEVSGFVVGADRCVCPNERPRIDWARTPVTPLHKRIAEEFLVSLQLLQVLPLFPMLK